MFFKKKEEYKSLAQREFENSLMEFKLMVNNTEELFKDEGKAVKIIQYTVPLVKVESSNIEYIGYYKDTLYIIFIKSGAYAYYNVPLSQYTGIVEAESKGQYLHRFIKGKFEYKKIEGYTVNHVMKYAS
jgi:hypothetical protein